MNIQTSVSAAKDYPQKHNNQSVIYHDAKPTEAQVKLIEKLLTNMNRGQADKVIKALKS